MNSKGMFLIFFEISFLIFSLALSSIKSDLIDDKAKLKIKKNISKNIKNVPFEFISSVSNIGLVEIKDLLWKVLNE